jgi:predicted exporter
MLVVALAVLFLVARPGPLWSDDLASLSPIPISDQRSDEQMRRDIGAPDVRHLLVVNAKDQETVLQASEQIGEILQRLSQQRLLGGFESPATYLPSLASQRARQAALPAPQTLRENLQQALQGLPFRPGLFEPFLRDVAAAREQSLLDRSGLQGTSLALKLDSLLVKRGEGWAAMLPLRGVTDPAAITRELARLPGKAGRAAGSEARVRAFVPDVSRGSHRLLAAGRRRDRRAFVRQPAFAAARLRRTGAAGGGRDRDF